MSSFVFTNLRHQKESQQTANGTDGQQDQLTSVALTQVRWVKVHQGCHQTLQPDKLSGVVGGNTKKGLLKLRGVLICSESSCLPDCPSRVE